MIPVLSRVSGYVQAVNVQENEAVKPGQPLVEVDPSELQQRLAQAQAELEAAQAGAGGAGLAGAQARPPGPRPPRPGPTSRRPRRMNRGRVPTSIACARWRSSRS